MGKNLEGKEQKVTGLHEKFTSSTVAILMEMRGLNVSEMTELRRKLRGVKGELRVVKNTMARRAADGTPMAAVQENFEGPIAVTFGYADPIAPAKILKKFIGERSGKVKFKAGVVEGQALDASGIEAVASLPEKDVLIGNLVRQLQSPISGLVMTLQGVIRKVVFVLDAIRDQRSKA